MKDVTLAIRTAIVSKLRNKVSYQGVTIPVRARVQNTNDSNYIYIPTQNSTNTSSKSCFATDQTITIECVYRDNDGVDSGLHSIVNQVMQLLITHDNEMILSDGLGLVSFEFVSKNDLTDIDGVGYIFRSVLTFQAFIDE